VNKLVAKLSQEMASKRKCLDANQTGTRVGPVSGNCQATEAAKILLFPPESMKHFQGCNVFINESKWSWPAESA
jgi:hypothetical protein